MVQMVTTVFTMLFIASVQPFKEDIHNSIEIYNEFTFLLLIYTTFAFTDLISSTEAQYNVGWVFILIFSINVFFHISYLFKDVFIKSKTVAKRVQHRLEDRKPVKKRRKVKRPKPRNYQEHMDVNVMADLEMTDRKYLMSDSNWNKGGQMDD